jgi:hypothetical protein
VLKEREQDSRKRMIASGDQVIRIASISIRVASIKQTNRRECWILFAFHKIMSLLTM